MEAKQEGLNEDIVPEMIQQTAEEIDDDLKKVMRQQALLIAELSKAYAEEDAVVSYHYCLKPGVGFEIDDDLYKGMG